MEAIRRAFSTPTVDWGQASRAIQRVSNDVMTPVTSSPSILSAGVAGIAMGVAMGFGVGVAWGGPPFFYSRDDRKMGVFVCALSLSVIAVVARQYAIYIRGADYAQRQSADFRETLSKYNQNLRGGQGGTVVYGISAVVLGGAAHLLGSHWIPRWTLGGLAAASAASSVVFGATSAYHWFHPPIPIPRVLPPLRPRR